MNRLASGGDQLTGPFCWPPAVAAGAYCGWLMVSGAGDGECVLLWCEGSAIRSVWLSSRALKLKVGLASFHQSIHACLGVGSRYILLFSLLQSYTYT